MKRMCSFNKLQSHFLLTLVVSGLVMSTAQYREKSVNENRKHLISVRSKSIPVLIDSMRQHYLTLEHDLWGLMDSGIDTAYILEKIHSTHLTLFGQHFGEFNVTFDDYAFDRQTQLLGIMSNINQTIAFVVKNSLRENPLGFDEQAAISTNRYQIDLTHQMYQLFNMTGTQEFFETIQKVSGCDLIAKQMSLC